MRIRAPWKKTTEHLLTLLRDSGFEVRRSFDLRTAKEGLQDPGACQCAHHGTEQCTCQYQIFLLYGQVLEPITLVIHGHDEWTHITLKPESSGNAEELYEKVDRLLVQARMVE